MKILLLTGGNHPFKETTPILEKLFYDNEKKVKVSESAKELESKNFDFDLIVLNTLRQKDYKNNLNDGQKQGLKKLITQGVGLVSIHIAAASCPDWKEMKNITGGGWVTNGKSWHPPIGWFKVEIEDKNHPIVEDVKEFWTYDECYCDLDFKENNHTFITGSIENNIMPIGWSSKYGNGKVSNISLGHSAIGQSHPMFQKLIINSLNFVVNK
ncbi:MAG: hypothetical protein CL774_03085 [Chloroflexi bacterium]|nr:hypothetical protein [Chloroflexota bacterium]